MLDYFLVFMTVESGNYLFFKVRRNSPVRLSLSLNYLGKFLGGLF